MVQALSFSVLLMLCMQHNGPSGKRPRGSESGARFRAPPAWHSQHCALRHPCSSPSQELPRSWTRGTWEAMSPCFIPAVLPGSDLSPVALWQ